MVEIINKNNNYDYFSVIEAFLSPTLAALLEIVVDYFKSKIDLYFVADYSWKFFI